MSVLEKLWQKVIRRKPLRRFFRGEQVLTPPVELHRHRVYILPTQAGIAFTTLLALMLLGAMNYQNSLAYILSFLLISLVLVSMVETYRQILGLRIHIGHIEPVFAGKSINIPLIIGKPGKPMHFAVNILGDHFQVSTDLLHSKTTVHAHFSPLTRGRFSLGLINVTCRHPFGLFHVWSPLPLNVSYLVFPKPEQQPPAPCWQSEYNKQEGQRHNRGDDYAGLKPYYPGDPIKHIHWKAHAKGQGLQTKHFSSSSEQTAWLDWNDTNGLPLEQRLSRLCSWLIDAERNGHRYGLRLPQKIVPIDSGRDHLYRCLTQLALYEQTAAAQVQNVA